MYVLSIPRGGSHCIRPLIAPMPPPPNSYVVDTVKAVVKKLPVPPTLILMDGASVQLASQPALEIAFRGMLTGRCLGHCVNLFFKDVGGVAVVSAIIDKSVEINNWLKTQKPAALLRKYSNDHLGRSLGTITPTNVRFGLFFIMIERLHRLLPALRALVMDPLVVDCGDDQPVVSLISDAAFWRSVKVLVGRLWPPMYFLRLTDNDKPYMGVAVEGWRSINRRLQSGVDQAAEGEGEGCMTQEVLTELATLWLGRSPDGLGPIHFAAYLCNPSLRKPEMQHDTEAMAGFRECVHKLLAGEADVASKVARAVSDLDDYLMGQGAFLDPQGDLWTAAKEAVPFAPPGKGGVMTYTKWWRMYGGGAPILQRVAVKVLAQVVGIGAAERGHKTQKFLQNKLRNRMDPQTANKLTCTHNALRTRAKLEEWAEEEEDEGIARAVAAVQEWVEENERLAKEGKGGDPEEPEGGGGGEQGAAWHAYQEDWEAGAKKDKSQTSVNALREKYVNMKFIRKLPGGVEEPRVIIGIRWVIRQGRGEYKALSNLLVRKQVGTGVVYQQARQPRAKKAGRKRGGDYEGESESEDEVEDCTKLEDITPRLIKQIKDCPLNEGWSMNGP